MIAPAGPTFRTPGDACLSFLSGGPPARPLPRSKHSPPNSPPKHYPPYAQYVRSRACYNVGSVELDEGEVEEGEEHDVELVKPALSRRKSLSNRALAFTAPTTEIQSQLACLIVLIGAVHQQWQRLGQWSQTTEQLAALLGVVRLAGRESKGYRRSSICGNHMNLGGPSAAGFADRLRTVFFNAPVPSG